MFVSLSEFLAKSDEYVYKLADNLLDAVTNGEHSKSLKESEPVSLYCDILTDPRSFSFSTQRKSTGWNVRASVYWVRHVCLCCICLSSRWRSQQRREITRMTWRWESEHIWSWVISVDLGDNRLLYIVSHCTYRNGHGVHNDKRHCVFFELLLHMFLCFTSCTDTGFHFVSVQ